MPETDEIEFVVVNDNKYDGVKLTKMLLIAGGSWLVGRGVELAVNAIVERRTGSKTDLEIIE